MFIQSYEELSVPSLKLKDFNTNDDVVNTFRRFQELCVPSHRGGRRTQQEQRPQHEDEP